MKEPLFTSGRKRRELVTFLICFIAAYILIVIGIIKYGSPVKELITQLHVVLLIAVIFYISIVILRILYYLVSRLWLLKK